MFIHEYFYLIYKVKIYFVATVYNYKMYIYPHIYNTDINNNKSVKLNVINVFSYNTHTSIAEVCLSIMAS